MLIADEEISADENDKDAQYNEESEPEEDEPNKASQEPVRTNLENGHIQDKQDDMSTDTETEKDEDYYEGQFDDEDFEGIVVTRRTFYVMYKKRPDSHQAGSYWTANLQ